MPYSHFLIPAEGGEAEKRLDVFLRSHAILKIEQRFVDRPESAFWAYAIHYDPLPAVSTSVTSVPKRELGKDRVDYEKVLGERDFALFVKLRDWRAGLAEKGRRSATARRCSLWVSAESSRVIVTDLSLNLPIGVAIRGGGKAATIDQPEVAWPFIQD